MEQIEGLLFLLCLVALAEIIIIVTMLSLQLPAALEHRHGTPAPTEKFTKLIRETFCYTGVDQITTKGAGGSTHCQDNMLPRRECFLRIERALHRFCHKPSEGLARSVVLSHHSRAKVLRSLLKA